MALSGVEAGDSTAGMGRAGCQGSGVIVTTGATVTTGVTGVLGVAGVAGLSGSGGSEGGRGCRGGQGLSHGEQDLQPWEPLVLPVQLGHSWALQDALLALPPPAAAWVPVPLPPAASLSLGAVCCSAGTPEAFSSHSYLLQVAALTAQTLLTPASAAGTIHI